MSCCSTDLGLSASLSQLWFEPDLAVVAGADRWRIFARSAIHEEIELALKAPQSAFLLRKRSRQ